MSVEVPSMSMIAKFNMLKVTGYFINTLCYVTAPTILLTLNGRCVRPLQWRHFNIRDLISFLKSVGTKTQRETVRMSMNLTNWGG